LLPDKDIPKLAKLYHEKKIPLEKIISRRYKLEEINLALFDLEQRKINRGLIEIQPELAADYL
jgi:S-(hydroxymethyl)glutathione dehydrogenase / alcohol dehydrogenase